MSARKNASSSNPPHNTPRKQNQLTESQPVVSPEDIRRKNGNYDVVPAKADFPIPKSTIGILIVVVFGILLSLYSIYEIEEDERVHRIQATHGQTSKG